MQPNQAGIVWHGKSRPSLNWIYFRVCSGRPCAAETRPALIDARSDKLLLDQTSGEVHHDCKQVTGAKAQWVACTLTCKHTHTHFAVVHSVNTTGITIPPPPHTKTSHLCLFSSTLAACMKLASRAMLSAPFMLLRSLLSKSSCCTSYDSVAFGSVTQQQFKIPPVMRVLLSSVSCHEFLSRVTRQLTFYSDQFVKWSQPCKVRLLNYSHACMQRLSCACSSRSFLSCLTYWFRFTFTGITQSNGQPLLAAPHVFLK